MTTRLVICDTCAALGDTPKGADWAKQVTDAAAQAGVDVDITTTSCMNMCQSPTAFALQDQGKATYLFAKADPDLDTDDLVNLLRLYGASSDGWLTDARDAGRLRECLVGWVPAI